MLKAKDVRLIIDGDETKVDCLDCDNEFSEIILMVDGVKICHLE